MWPDETYVGCCARTEASSLLYVGSTVADPWPSDAIVHLSPPSNAVRQDPPPASVHPSSRPGSLLLRTFRRTILELHHLLQQSILLPQVGDLSLEFGVLRLQRSDVAFDVLDVCLLFGAEASSWLSASSSCMIRRMKNSRKSEKKQLTGERIPHALVLRILLCTGRGNGAGASCAGRGNGAGASSRCRR